MEIRYEFDIIPSPQKIIELYNTAGLPRPTDDKDRIQLMYKNSNLVITAWDNDTLVGVARCITDWVWSTYLADLAVHPSYKASGIGRRLITLVKEKGGEQTMVLLLSVPTAMDYYPRVGFTKDERAFSISRTK